MFSGHALWLFIVQDSMMHPLHVFYTISLSLDDFPWVHILDYTVSVVPKAIRLAMILFSSCRFVRYTQWQLEKVWCVKGGFTYLFIQSAQSAPPGKTVDIFV